MNNPVNFENIKSSDNSEEIYKIYNLYELDENGKFTATHLKELLTEIYKTGYRLVSTTDDLKIGVFIKIGY